MATLEKIRSKSAILFTVIIVALLAFILGDFFNSSRSFFGPGTTAAKVDGHKIDIQDFNARVERTRQMMQERGYNQPDLAMIQNQVLQEMVYEQLLNAEMENLGIVVTNNELSEAMTGTNALPMLVQQVQQQFGVQTPAQLHDMAFNPTKYQIPAETAQQLQQYWIEMEKSVEQQLKQEKLANLFNGALTANDIDAQAVYDDDAVTRAIEYTRIDLNSLNDSTLNPTDDEIKAKYNEIKNRFKLEQPVRRVQYVSVDIVPSADDILKAQQDVEAALELLNNNEGTDGLSGYFVVNNVTNKKDGLQPAVASVVDSLAPGQARIASFANNRYTLAKLNALNENVSDSVKISFAIAAVKNTEHRDSIINVLNGGAKIEEISEIVNSQPSTAYSLISGESATLRDLIADAQTGVYFTPDTAATAEQVRIVRVDGYSPKVTTYDVAVIDYQIDPSSTTINQLRDGLRNFVAGKNAEQFTEEAAKEGYHSFPAEVTPQSLSLANLPDSRGAVKWALKAKKGEVSDVYGDEQTGRFIAVALNDIYDKGFTPLSDASVNGYVRSLAANDKKAAKLIADYSGKGTTVQDYAIVMGQPVDSTTVNFSQQMVSGFPFGESDIIAYVSAAPVGKVVGPVKSNSTVVVFKVLSDVKNGREFNADQDRARFLQQQGPQQLGAQMYNILLGKKQIQNNLLQFYQD